MATSTIPEIPVTGILPAANDFFETGGNTNGSLKVGAANFPQQVTTLAILAALSVTNVANNVTVLVTGGAAALDGGGGIFVYQAASTATPNGTTVIAPNLGAGRWIFAPSGLSNSALVLLKAQNLNDLPNKVTARANLGLGNAALEDVGTIPGTVASGNDARIVGAAQRVANLSDLTNKQAAKFNLNIIEINVLDYGADYLGATDSTAAIAAAIAACYADGPCTEIIINNYMGGWGVPNNDWSGRPSITLIGGINGSGGFQGWGNINSDGYLCAIEIANRGVGYTPIAALVNRTLGSQIITAAVGQFDPRIIAGVSVRHESTFQGAYVLSRDSNTQLTLSYAMTFTNQDWFVFGIPNVVVAGTQYYDNFIPILGTAVNLLFPAGRYLVPNGCPGFIGLMNTTINAVGVDFISTVPTGATAAMRMCIGCTFNGGTFKYLGARYQVPANPGRSIRYPGQVGFGISCCQQVIINGTKTMDAFMFGFAISGNGVPNSWLCNRIFLNDCHAINSLGDGIHVTAGTKTIRINNCTVLAPGDDALAAVNDGNFSQRPNDIIFSNCNIEGGIYRGCVAIGSDFVEFRNIYGVNTHGPFCWAAADGGVPAPSNIVFDGVIADLIGNPANSITDTNSGIGITAGGMAGLTLRGCRWMQDPGVFAVNSVINLFGGLTNFNWDAQSIIAPGGYNTYMGSINQNLDCQGANGFASVNLPQGVWLVQGTIAARAATGSPAVIFPRLWDGFTTLGEGAAMQLTDPGMRAVFAASAVVYVRNNSAIVRFLMIQDSLSGVTIDAGSTFGPNSQLVATRLG